MQAYAPGRVELLGNHTDYNQGVVLAAAISRGITVQGEACGDLQITLQSDGPVAKWNLARGWPERSREQGWANYSYGVVRGLLEAGHPVQGFRARISTTLPAGAGLSSSAALEVATCLFLEKLFDFQLAPMERAKLCQRAENHFVGVNSGLLDQASSVFGEEDAAIYLDCRLEKVTTIPLPPGLALLITDSGAKHELTGGEYNERRASCFAAAKILGVPALRDTTTAEVLAAKMEEVTRRRALHVTGEIERVLRGVELLSSGDGPGFGELMWASHESSRVNFENSTPELDALVEISHGIDGVYGSRLTGGGFGGATVSLIDPEKAELISEELGASYLRQTGITAKSYLTRMSRGAE